MPTIFTTSPPAPIGALASSIRTASSVKPALSEANGFTTSLADLRVELGFRIIGYVLMPEHCHLLLWPSELANPS